MTGFFIAIEGADGSGKTEIAKRLAAALQVQGHNVFATREPSDLPIGRMIREVLTGRLRIDSNALPALFAADRADHTERVSRRDTA